MLDLPGVVVAQAVGELDLVERVLVEPVLVALFPGAGQLQLVEDTEFHGASSEGRSMTPNQAVATAGGTPFRI